MGSIAHVDTRTRPWKRLGYHGLFSVRDVEIDDYVLTLAHPASRQPSPALGTLRAAKRADH